MTVVLYRPHFDIRSGAGQLLEMQWRGLTVAGVETLLVCERGALKFWLRTGVRARRRSIAEVERLREQGAIVVDHGMSIASAQLVFVHNLAAEAGRHLPVHAAVAVQREREFFRALSSSATVVANSKLVARALHEHFGIASERVTVLYPGFESRRYSRQRAADLRSAARRSLGIDSATRIAAARPDARFLVVGSKRLPQEAREHALVRAGVVQYRPKSRHPEPWFAALDLFLYTARFEEFGMVVAEAQAMGIPVLTSKQVGASECLPSAYAPWLPDAPVPGVMAERALALLADAELREQLAAAAAATIVAFDERAYIEGTKRLLDAQKLRLK
jgi:glycosyltransferase involved in cell wall biosynthesis